MYRPCIASEAAEKGPIRRSHSSAFPSARPDINNCAFVHAPNSGLYRGSLVFAAA